MRAEIAGMVLVSLALAASGCESRPERASAQPVTPVFTSDSARQVQLAGFRRNLPETTELEGGRESREALVRSMVTALETRDTAALRGMALSRSEFGWLYYPTNPQSRPPYDLDPGLYWFMLSQHSAKGLGKALETMGGKSLGYSGFSCDTSVSHEGENTVYGPCLVRMVQAPGDTAEARVFSLMIERHGRWKFVSYANKLD